MNGFNLLQYVLSSFKYLLESVLGVYSLFMYEQESSKVKCKNLMSPIDGNMNFSDDIKSIERVR